MKDFKENLRKYSDEDKAKVLQGFFKTGKGQYGEGDIFLGVSVPKTREISKKAVDKFSLDNVQELLESRVHEERLAGILILTEKYKKAGDRDKKINYNFYLANAKCINNWDLVDLSAPKVVGNYLLEKKNRYILYEFAKSENLWEKRIAIVSTFSFIRDGQFDDTLRISKILLGDSHDLIHKAVGWMLREVGKRDKKLLEKFLRDNYSELPRTTLRYAIERFEEEERGEWLKGKFKS